MSLLIKNVQSTEKRPVYRSTQYVLPEVHPLLRVGSNIQFCSFFVPLFLGVPGTHYAYVPGITVAVGLQVIRDGVPKLVRTVLLRSGTAVHALFCLCFLLSERVLACFVATSYRKNITIVIILADKKLHMTYLGMYGEALFVGYYKFKTLRVGCTLDFFSFSLNIADRSDRSRSKSSRSQLCLLYTSPSPRD